MGLLLVTMQVRVVEFPTTTLVKVAVTSTSGGTAVGGRVLENACNTIIVYRVHART